MGSLFTLKCPKCGEVAPRDYKGVQVCLNCNLLMEKEWVHVGGSFRYYGLIIPRELDDELKEKWEKSGSDDYNDWLVEVLGKVIK